MNKKLTTTLLLMTTIGSLHLNAYSVILNEYNAVAPDKQLKNNGYDTHFGDVNGNGGDWIELAVTEDFLDLRGATLKIERSKGVPLFSGVFPDLTKLAYLRKGTIITISNEPTDLSYNPLDDSNPDWNININVNDLVNKSGSFDISDLTMDIWIEAIDKSILMPHSGEIVKGWGIDDEEVFKLKKEPSALIQPDDSAYGDDASGKQIISTFGAPNQWIDSNDQQHTQDFSQLRDINSSVNKMVLLNEYDAVGSNNYLKDNGYDTKFGRIEGNGGNWLEIVILRDNLDLRGSELKIKRGNNEIYRATLPNITALSSLRSGTILTISDTEPTDLSYNPFDPCNDDWNININSNDLNTIEGEFKIDETENNISLKSGSGDIIIMPESGEGITTNNIDSTEVFKLKANPSSSIEPTDTSYYGDDNNQQALSTFGTPNHWKDANGNLVEQNLTSIRLIALEKNFRAKGHSLLLNEYNAVASDKYLKSDGSDNYFGTVAGNGGIWAEFVVTSDYTNLQNAKIQIKENCSEIFTGKIPELLSLAYLRKGTIVTISEEPTDMSYHPFKPTGNDWKLNININDLTDTTGSFKTNDNNISISIMSADNTKTLLAPSGEGVWKSVVDNTEVYKLKAEPTAETTPFDFHYGDDFNNQSISTFSSPNQWCESSLLKTQQFSIRNNKDLAEIGGIALSEIAGLEELRDAESILYINANDSLWITDDDSHQVFEMDYTTKTIKSIIKDTDLGNFASDIGECRHDSDGEYIGACDIESVAYDSANDTFYILTGMAPGTPAIFKLTRNSTSDPFALSDYKKLNGIEYPAAIFIDGNFIVAQLKSLYTYDFNSNAITSSTPLYTTPTGKIVGLAYDGTYLWVTTSNFELMKVDWATKETLNIYSMGDNGVYDPRGIEVIDGKLHILEGINHSGGDVNAPIGHVLKNAIHIYQKP
ncbi:MAG: hypothetical protein GXO02_06010 [Epsilonproteobacteria bacterium]|nr:hypothetical protein [Campylobacterota bacterium]